MAERKYFSANTVEQAVLQAARHYQLRPEELAYEQIEKRHGYVRSRKRVLIQIDPAAPRRVGPAAPAPRVERPTQRAETERHSEPVENAARERVPEAAPQPEEVAEPDTTPVSMEPPPPPVFDPPAEVAAEEEMGEDWGEDEREGAPEAWVAGEATEAEEERTVEPERPRVAPEGGYPYSSQIEGAKAAIERLFGLAGVDLEATVKEGAEGLLEIEIRGADQELLLRDRGRLLMALQHLMPRTIRGLTGEPSPCHLDSDNFHEVREERLRDLAQRVASEVRKEGRSRTMDPMAPDERRIIHMTLADDVGVTTESKGQGLFKRVVVSPVEARRRPRGFDPYRNR